jgi:hypothetical protein
MKRAALLVIAGVAVLLLVTLVGLLIEVRSAPPASVAERPTVSLGAASPAAPPATQPSPRSRADSDQPGPPAMGTATAEDRASARIERAQLIEALRDSGPASESWVGRATTLLEEISKEYAAGMTPEGCYIAGCAGTFVFASVADYERAIAASMALPDYQGWTGGKRWTTPEHAPDGRVLVALLLYRPD